jgi:hypothetical protein
MDVSLRQGAVALGAIANGDTAIAAHEDWLAADGYHCGGQEAGDLYAQTVLAALDLASKRRSAKVTPCPRALSSRLVFVR